MRALRALGRRLIRRLIRRLARQERFALYDERESVHEFVVPDKTVRVELSLSGEVEFTHSDSKQGVSAQSTFELNSIDLTRAMDDIFLRRTATGYKLVSCIPCAEAAVKCGDDVRRARVRLQVCVGKSGRMRSGRSFQISLQHAEFTDTINTTLQV